MRGVGHLAPRSRSPRRKTRGRLPPSAWTLGAGQVATVDIPADHPLTTDEFAGLQTGMKWLKAHGEIVFTADPPPSTPVKHPHFCFVLTQLGNAMEVCDNFGDHTDQGVFR